MADDSGCLVDVKCHSVFVSDASGQLERCETHRRCGLVPVEVRDLSRKSAVVGEYAEDLSRFRMGSPDSAALSAGETFLSLRIGEGRWGSVPTTVNESHGLGYELGVQHTGHGQILIGPQRRW